MTPWTSKTFILIFTMISNFCFAEDIDLLKNTVKSTVENLVKTPDFGKAITSAEACNLNPPAVAKNSLIIPVNISLGTNLKFSVDDIKEAISEAENCWNTALENAGEKNLKVSMNVKTIISLTDEGDIIGNINEPALDHQGYPLKKMSQGYSASEYNIIISNKIERSHVKPYWDKKISLNIRRKALEVGRLSVECNRIYTEELDPLQKIPYEQKNDEITNQIDKVTKKYYEVCDQLQKLQDDLDSKGFKLPGSNLVYLSPEKSKQELAQTIAHELGHAWGGLDDRYKGESDSRQKNRNNLMGLDAVCKLEKNQVESIRKYRKNGKEEVFDSN